MALNEYLEHQQKANNMIAWNLKSFEIQTQSIEKTLKPLVKQVTALVNQGKKKEGFKKGRPNKKALQLVREIESATALLVQVGRSICNDFPEINTPMSEACKDTESAGKTLSAASNEFVHDPCNPAKRNKMVQASRSLLSQVTRLLCIADMADVFRLLSTLRKIEDKVKELKSVNSLDVLLSVFKKYGDVLSQVAKLTAFRQADLIDQYKKEKMAFARTTLRRSSRLLLTTSKAYMNHPELSSTKQNRDFVIDQVNTAFSTIAVVAKTTEKSKRENFVGYLAKAFEDLYFRIKKRAPSILMKNIVETQLEKQAIDANEERQNQDDLQTIVEEVANGAIDVADSVCTREKRREKILTECGNMRKAVDSLILENEPVENTKEDIQRNAKQLSKHVEKAVVDHVSDTFLETNLPLTMLTEAAESGNITEVEKCSDVFLNHVGKLLKVAELACSISDNAEGIRMVKIAANQLSILSPQVVNAAITLVNQPQSTVVLENLKLFHDEWLFQVNILTEAVDDIITIDDFLAVSESHILEDISTCVEAIENHDFELLDKTAGAIRGRDARIQHVVTVEMESYEKGPYVDGVLKAVETMKKSIMPEFVDYVDIVVEALKEYRAADIDENIFADISHLVHQGIRDIRQAVSHVDHLSIDSDIEEDKNSMQGSMVSQMEEELAKQRERLAYKQLIASGKIQFEIQSEGVDDPGCTGSSSIVVNGVEYSPRKCGHNIVVLDECGTVVKCETFDTTLHEDCVAMSSFLEDIPNDNVVFIAVQETGGSDIKIVREALENVGVTNPIDAGFGSSWAFAGYKGDHQKKRWVSQVTHPRYQGPSMISNTINTPAADMGKIYIEMQAGWSNDGPHESIPSIKVNTIERSPMGRGMNVVVLDNAGNHLLSKTFDTSDPQHAINEGRRMARFLGDLPNERIVAVTSAESLGIGLAETKAALLRLGGREPLEPGDDGSFVLIGYTGNQQEVDWIQQLVKTQGQSKVAKFLLTPAVTSRNGGRSRDYDLEEIKNSKKDENIHERVRLMKGLPEEEKKKINKLNEGLIQEKNILISEVNKWDEQGNDIIVLAKRMCMIMMEMSDYTRGIGPLKTTLDVIRAAEKIGKCGAQLNKLAGDIAELCPHSRTRSDLLAYLERMALFSHQLTITAKVKSDVQVIGGEMIVSGVESATSLIQAAKNLMNTVILAVKASYIASTKHRTEGTEVVTWRMVTPKKKPLIEKRSTDSQHVIRSYSPSQSPAPSLGDFQ